VQQLAWPKLRLLDHLVGDGEDPRRHLDAERSRLGLVCVLRSFSV
jgi:hypothetical protein